MKKLYFLIAAMVANCGLTMADTTDGQIYWGYTNDNERIASIGLGFPEKLFFAQELPANHPLLAGKTLKGIRFRCQGTEFYDEAEVWVAPYRPETDDEISELISLDPTTLHDTVWNEVAVTPVEIPAEGLCVGWNMYAHDISDHRADYPCLISYPEGVRDVAEDEVFWMRASQYMTNWIASPRYGHLCLQVLVEGEYGEYVVTLGDVEPQMGLAGQTVNVPLQLVKMGSQDITDIDYTLMADGQSLGEFHVVLDKAISEVATPQTVEVEIPVGDEARLCSKQIAVVRVNGHDNEAAADEAQTSVDVIALSHNAHRRTVMEEYTGTWCGWCPRGFVAMERLNADLGDDFIGIAVHASDPWQMGEDYDPMGILPYQDLVCRVSSYPNSSINRTFMCDPYAGSEGVNYGIIHDVEREQAKLTLADIELVAQWEDDDCLTLNSQAKVTFAYNCDDAPYALAYVLLSDSLSHPNDPDWIQSNFYSYFTDDEEYTSNPDFAPYLAQPAYILDQVYNHVAVDAYGVDGGLEESIAAPLVDGQTQVFDFSIDVDFNALIQDKSQLSLVAMLIEQRTGQIVNAACCPILPAGTQVGIEVLATDAAKAVHYTLDGKLTADEPSVHGFVIERNGQTVRKVIR